MGIRSKPNSHGTPTGLLAVVMITLAAVSAADAQTNLQGRIVLRSVSTDDIAAYKLPASTQRSGGLATVGLGQPAYLDALVNIEIPAADIAGVNWLLVKKPASSAAALEDSPLGATVLPGEPSDRVSSRVAGRTMLRPDVAGRYTVTATISTASGTTSTSTVVITAATYVGISACAVCHSGGPASTRWSAAESWAKTVHAEIFKDGVNGATGHYAESCLGCHTVGHDTNAKAVNGGFDDVAAKLKWVFPATQKPGTFEAVPDELKNVANVQCENCHGPGSKHVANGGDFRMISVSLGSGDCGQCHGALSHHFKTAEWENSKHAVTTTDPSGTGREGCVGCHTAGGFIGRIKGAKTVSTVYNSINCQTCHEPHGQTKPGNNAHLVRALGTVKLADGTVVDKAGMGALCMNCHQSRRNAVTYVATTAGSSHFGPHEGPQADMLQGTNGFTYGRTIATSNKHAAVENTCVTCHMQVVESPNPAFTKAGGHTFRASWTDESKTRHDVVTACQKCHGNALTSFDVTAREDYDGDGKIEGVQTEVQHLLDQLAKLLPPAGTAKTELAIEATWTKAQLQAAYNYQFVKADGSLGVHNTAYAVGLLKASIADLGGNAGK